MDDWLLVELENSSPQRLISVFPIHDHAAAAGTSTFGLWALADAPERSSVSNPVIDALRGPPRPVRREFPFLDRLTWPTRSSEGESCCVHHARCPGTSRTAFETET
jgi:hypothetical protein